MSLSKRDIVLVGGVTVLSCYQLANFARKVGAARSKFSVEPPATSGPDGFNRVFRAHQNSLELFPVYMGTMWTSALFLHQVPASAVGIIYLYSRHKYMEGYSKDTKARVGPFMLTVRCIQALLLMSFAGVANAISAEYFDYDVIGQIIARFFKKE